jgi:hypothetical protein
VNLETEILGRRVSGSVPPDVATWVTTQLVESTDVAAEPMVTASPFSIVLASRADSAPRAIVEGATRSTPLGTRLLGTEDEFWMLERVDGTEQGVHGELADGRARLSSIGEPFGAWTALRQAFHEVLLVSGVVRVHAAVVCKGSDTVALLGPSGRGKSTTVVRAAAGGWRPLGEDAAFLDVVSLTVVNADEHDHVRMRPAPTASRVAMPDAVTSRPEGERMAFDFAELGGRAPPSTLTHLARMVRTPDPSPRWRPMTRADAVMALHEAVGVPATRQAGRMLGATFGDLVGRVRLVTLELGAPSELLPDLPRD